MRIIMSNLMKSYVGFSLSIYAAWKEKCVRPFLIISVKNMENVKKKILYVIQ